MDPAQSPRHMASATLGWAAPSGIALSAILRYVGKQYEDDLQTDVLSDALTVDGTATLPISSSVRLVARGENIFDEKVVTRNDDGDRKCTRLNSSHYCASRMPSSALK